MVPRTPETLVGFNVTSVRFAARIAVIASSGVNGGAATKTRSGSNATIASTSTPV